MPTAPKRRRPLKPPGRRRELRPSSSARGYGRRWQKYSRGFLAANPFCRICNAAGRVSASEATDHIEPISGPSDPLFWSPANHQALCWSCHSRKTATENAE